MHPLSLAILLMAVLILLRKRGVWVRDSCAGALVLRLVFGSPMVTGALLRGLAPPL